ncbi:MAG TPA: hypothetical protein VK879_05000 [Candidatus Sulfomarinibacteraceae bacterium]|nr:hypothetical protein [Candidatus Sulfomarinibacteraceae bacterium]
MSWIYENKQYWRAFALALMVVAIAGPWGFDRIHVPAPHECSSPHVRLDDMFCGLPLSLAWSLNALVAGFRSAGFSVRAAVGIPLPGLSILLLPLLPLATTAVLLWRGDGQPWRNTHLAALVTAAVTVLFVAALNPYAPHWALWGYLLYAPVALVMLLLELLALASDRATAYE